MNLPAKQTAPPYQLLPPLYPEERDALKDNIRERGVLVPVEYDDVGNILDGHNRVDICAELGITKFPKIIREGLSEQEKRSHVRTLNLVRRHLNRMQRQGLICDQLKETPTISDRAIAARLGVSHVTVGGTRKRMERRGQLDHVTTRTDTLGRSQPAHRQRGVYIENVDDDHPDERSVGLASDASAGPAPLERSKNEKATNGGHTVGNKTRTKKQRGNDFNQTPRCGIITLLQVEEFSPTVWEPACGLGAISSVLEERNYSVELSDLIDRGCADRHGEVQRVEDFLTSKKRKGKCPDIVTNAPFGPINAFIAHALREHGPDKIAILCNLNILCGFQNPDRIYFRDQFPPSRIHIFTRRLPMMHAEDFDGEKSTSQMNCAWMVWEKGKDGTYPTSPSQTFSQDWKLHMAGVGEVDWKPDD